MRGLFAAVSRELPRDEEGNGVEEHASNEGEQLQHVVVDLEGKAVAPKASNKDGSAQRSEKEAHGGSPSKR